MGFNIFVYLAKGTEGIEKLLRKLLSIIGFTTSQTVNVAATGAKSVINKTADVTDTGLSTVQNILPTNQAKRGKEEKEEKKKASDMDSFYKEDDASSSIQKAAGKQLSGFCYIGEDRGYRSCSKVSESDICVSGDIFPTMEKCIHPNLRY